MDLIYASGGGITFNGEKIITASGGVLTDAVRRNYNLFNFNDVRIYAIQNGSAIADYENKTITMHANGSDNYAYIMNIQLKPNTTYSWSVKADGNYQLLVYTWQWFQFPDNEPAVFTTTDTGYVNLRIDNETGGTLVFSEFMLNEGGVALPYDEYYGDIIYDKDIDATLCWENGGISLTTATIDITNLLNYKYCVILFAHWDGDGISISKFPVQDGEFNICSTTHPSIAGINSRKFTISGNTLTFNEAVVGNTAAESYKYLGACPLQIYGTNIL